MSSGESIAWPPMVQDAKVADWEKGPVVVLAWVAPAAALGSILRIRATESAIWAATTSGTSV